MAIAGILLISCTVEGDDDPEFADDDDDNERACEILCDDIYDCGMDVEEMSEPECVDDCDLDNSWWRCIRACVQANSCEAQDCIDSCG